MVDLRVRCFDLKAELAAAQGEITSLAEKTRGLEDGFARVGAEQDALRAEVEREAVAAQSLRAEVAKMKTELQLNEGAVAQAVQSVEAAWAETLQWKQKAEGNVLSTVLRVLAAVLALIPLFSLVQSRLGDGSGQRHHDLCCTVDSLGC
jgi:chromosome segregation ATPase